MVLIPHGAYLIDPERKNIRGALRPIDNEESKNHGAENSGAYP